MLLALLFCQPLALAAKYHLGERLAKTWGTNYGIQAGIINE